MRATTRRRTPTWIAVALGVLGLIRIVSRLGRTPTPVAPAPTYSFPGTVGAPTTALQNDPVAGAEAASPISAGPSRANLILWSRKKITDAAIASLAKAHAPSLTLSKQFEVAPTKAIYVVRRLTGGSIPTITATDLGYSGKGIGDEERATISKASEVVVLDVAAPAGSGLDALRELTALASALAPTPAVIVDGTTQQIFSAKFLAEHRVRDWLSGAPNVAEHAVVRTEPRGPSLRVVTSGMAKLGLPDLVLDGVSPVTSHVDLLMTLVCQRLAEGAILGADGHLSIDVDEVINPAARAALKQSVRSDGTGRAVVRLVVAANDEGGDHRLLTIDFSREPGATLQDRQAALIFRVFGRGETFAMKADPAREAASDRARKALHGLAPAFQRGWAPGEELLVKGPFATPEGGKEYMWISVRRWEGEMLTGLLTNEPSHVEGLHQGATVSVMEASIFDYIHRFPDGGVEGGEAETLLTSAKP